MFKTKKNGTGCKFGTNIKNSCIIYLWNGSTGIKKLGDFVHIEYRHSFYFVNFYLEPDVRFFYDIFHRINHSPHVLLFPKADPKVIITLTATSREHWVSIRVTNWVLYLTSCEHSPPGQGRFLPLRKVRQFKTGTLALSEERTFQWQSTLLPRTNISPKIYFYLFYSEKDHSGFFATFLCLTNLTEIWVTESVFKSIVISSAVSSVVKPQISKKQTSV